MLLSTMLFSCLFVVLRTPTLWCQTLCNTDPSDYIIESRNIKICNKTFTCLIKEHIAYLRCAEKKTEKFVLYIKFASNLHY